MYAAFIGLSEGIAAQGDAAYQSQITSGLFLVQLVLSGTSLAESWNKQQQTDVANAVEYQLEAMIPGNSGDAALATEANEQKTIDANEADLEQGKQNTIVTEQKSELQAEGDAMNNVYSLQQPEVEYMALLNSQIMQLG
jgi:hypothetical protein